MNKERTYSPVATGLVLALAILGCEKAADEDAPPAQPAVDAQMPPTTDGGGGADDDGGLGEDGRFLPGSMPVVLSNGGYIDSPFLNRAGDRFYFIHSIFAPAVLEGRATPEACSDLQVPQLPGHVTADLLEWNTDIYYVEWDGERWSEPVNLGAPINSLGMECCMWLNADETEIIFNRVSDLDSDGEDGDVGLPPTGNYIATRADRDAPWSDPVPLPDDYGVAGQTLAQYRHDMHKVPSGNLYLWEWFANGDNLLRFGERTGGTDEAPTYAAPVTIPGSTNFETQIWANDAETRLIYNHREADGETALHTRTRATADDPWGPSVVVETADFADEMGRTIWGEPSFDHTESFMMFVRFNSTDYECFQPQIMYSAGTADSGFAPPVVLN